MSNELIEKLREECQRVKSENDRLARHINKMITERDALRAELAEVKEQSETRWAAYVRVSNRMRELEGELAEVTSKNKD